MNKLIISLVVSLFIAVPASALAVDIPSTSAVKNKIDIKTSVQEAKDLKNGTQVEIRSLKQGVKTDLQNKKDNVKADLKDAKTNAVNVLKDKKSGAVADFKAAAEQKRESFKALAEQKREEFQQLKEAKREEIKNKAEAARTQLKAKLVKIKDEKKKAIVERVDNRIVELNNNQMDHLSNVLDQLDKVLLKINDRTDAAAAKGRDVTAVRTAIESAKTGIAAARAAIVAQSGKVYTITITTESKLGTDVGKATKLVHADIVGVREKVKTAREAVHKAATTLAQAYRVPETTTTTPSAGTEGSSTDTPSTTGATDTSASGTEPSSTDGSSTGTAGDTSTGGSDEPAPSNP